MAIKKKIRFEWRTLVNVQLQSPTSQYVWISFSSSYKVRVTYAGLINNIWMKSQSEVTKQPWICQSSLITQIIVKIHWHTLTFGYCILLIMCGYQTVSKDGVKCFSGRGKLTCKVVCSTLQSSHTFIRTVSLFLTGLNCRIQDSGMASCMETLPRASLTAKSSLQTRVKRSHRPQWRPFLVTLTGLGWGMGVPYRWGCFHLRIFPPFLAVSRFADVVRSYYCFSQSTECFVVYENVIVLTFLGSKMNAPSHLTHNN